MSEKEDVSLVAFTEFLNAVEAGISAARQRIKENKGLVSWDASKIAWVEAEGAKGKYERSEDVNNPNFKAMLKDVVAHGGRMNHQGFFYWVFQNGTTVGRKKK